MTADAGRATVEVHGDLDPLKRDMGSIDGMAKRAGTQTGQQFASGLASQKRRVSTVGASIKNAFVLAGGIALTRGIKAFTFDAAQEARLVLTQTEAVIKSTGGSANVTAEEVANLATEISNYSGINDEAIQEGQNLLLTFTGIRNEAGRGNKIFNEATKILTDMSVAMKTDVRSGAIQLGKALNDPVKGVSALSRVGVTFTEDQKKVIETLVETGDVAGAQKIILKELKKEFGGSAEAAGDVDPYARLQRRLENLGESIGTKMLPALDSATQGIIDTLEGDSGVQDSLNSFFDSFRANDQAVDDTSKLIAAFGEQLQAGVISADEYTRKVAQQTRQTEALARQFPDVISLQDELEFQYALSEGALRRYNAELYKNKINFQEADAAASSYLNTVGAAASVQQADHAASGNIPGGRGRARGGRGGGIPPGVATVGASSVQNNIVQIDARGSVLSEAEISAVVHRALRETGRYSVRQQRARTSSL